MTAVSSPHTATGPLPAYAPRVAGDPFWERTVDRLLAAIGSFAHRIATRGWSGAGYLAAAAALIAEHDLPTRRRIAYTPGVRPALVEIARLAPSGPDTRLEAVLAGLLRCVVLPAFDAGSTINVQLRSPDAGVLTLPGRPSVRLRLGEGDRRKPVQVRSDGTVLSIANGSRELVRIEGRGQARQGPAGLGRPQAVATIPGTAIAVDGEDEWSRRLIGELNRPETFSANGSREITPVLLPPAQVFANLADSARAMYARWPELAVEVTRNVMLVYPFSSRKVVGYSHAQHLGTVFLNVGLGEAAFLEERLVHEASHNQLFLMQQEQLIPEGNVRLLHSPLRKDPRPASGVIHATFVSARCAQWCRRSLDRHPGYADRVDFLESAARDGIRTLRDEGSLTPAGERLVAEIEQSLEVRP